MSEKTEKVDKIKRTIREEVENYGFIKFLNLVVIGFYINSIVALVSAIVDAVTRCSFTKSVFVSQPLFVIFVEMFKHLLWAGFLFFIGAWLACVLEDTINKMTLREEGRRGVN